MIQIPGTAYLLAAAFVAGAYSTYKVMDWRHDAELFKALEISRTLERGGVAIANKSDLVYIEKLRKQKEGSDAREAKFQRALDIAGAALRNCAVSPELVRLLNERRDAEPAAGPAAKPESAAAPPEAGSDCAAVIATYNWNIDNVVEPNRLQVEGLQEFYRALQRKFNRRNNS